MEGNPRLPRLALEDEKGNEYQQGMGRGSRKAGRWPETDSMEQDHPSLASDLGRGDMERDQREN